MAGMGLPWRLLSRSVDYPSRIARILRSSTFLEWVREIEYRPFIVKNNPKTMEPGRIRVSGNVRPH
jgi:hypothetical protein